MGARPGWRRGWEARYMDATIIAGIGAFKPTRELPEFRAHAVALAP